MFSCKTKVCTLSGHLRQRQYSGIDALFKSGDLCVGFQLFAACGCKNVSVGPFQPLCCFIHTVHADNIIHTPVLTCPHQTQAGNTFLFTGTADIFCYNLCIWMGGIHHYSEHFSVQQCFHLFFCQTVMGNFQMTALWQKALTVFRCHTDMGSHILCIQKLGNFSALYRSCKNQYFLHFSHALFSVSPARLCIRVVSPSYRQSLLSGNCR